MWMYWKEYIQWFIPKMQFVEKQHNLFNVKGTDPLHLLL